MASLYKKPVKLIDPKTGQKVTTRSKKWWGRYKDENGKERRIPLAADKAAAQAMLNELIKKVERRIAGIVDQFDEHRKRPIRDHLTDFERHLKSKGVSSQQVQLVTCRVGRIIEGSKTAFIGDLSASRVQAFLKQLREQGKSIQTSNHYLRAIKQFSRWLVRDRRSHDDPLAHVAMQNVAMDRRHDRRPLSEPEFAAVLRAADSGPIVRRMRGPDRAMLYRVAAYTGLRASELASLRPESFNFESDLPTVTVQAAYSKHRRTDVLPLHQSLVGLLRLWLKDRPAGEPVWPGNWARGKQAGAMLKQDLGAAGIAYVDENGLYADFHALRYTFITNMVKAGVSPKAAQSLARHSTIDLTMNVYTSLTVHDQASAIAALPPIRDLSEPVSQANEMQATGTDGPEKVPPVVPSGAKSSAIRLASDMYDPAPDCTEDGLNDGEGNRPKNARNVEENGDSCAKPHQTAPDCIERRERDSNPRTLSCCRFSRPVQSAALPSLRIDSSANWSALTANLRSCRERFFGRQAILPESAELGKRLNPGTSEHGRQFYDGCNRVMRADGDGQIASEGTDGIFVSGPDRGIVRD